MSFSTLFRDLYVYNYDNLTGKPLLKIPVHVSLDNKSAIYEYLKYGGSHKAIKEKDTQLPRIGIQMTDMSPAIDRQTSKDQGRVLSKTYATTPEGRTYVDKVKKDIQPMPFNIGYTISIWCKTIEHWAQIQENILPFFNPACFVGVRERELGIERQIRVVLDSVTPLDSFQGTNRRLIRSEMSFTCETVLYKNMSEDTGGIINNVWLWTIDLTTPFSSFTMNISGGPDSTVPPISGTESPSTSGVQ